MNGPLWDALSRALFHFLWEGALIAAVLALAIRVLRPRSAQVRYGLACAAMIAMVVAFAGTLVWFWPHSVSVVVHSNPPRMPVPPPRFDRPEATPSSAPPALNWFVLAWLAGAAVFSLRSLLAWVAATRLKRSGACEAAEVWREKLAHLGDRLRLSQPVMLLESCLTDVPVVVGFLRPAILVPAALFTGFPPDQLEMLLMHELAHIRRHDYLVNLLQSVVEDVLFYHPAVWWVSSVIRAERENCCDDIVVAETSNAHGFAAALAALEQNRWAAHEAALAANGGHLMNRVRRLLEGRDRALLVSAPAFFASLLPVVFVIAASASQAVSHAQSVTVGPPFPAAPSPMPPLLIAQTPVAQARPAPPALAASAELTSQSAKPSKQEVVYLITADERATFGRLKTDEERARFIEQFRLRRDPAPNSGPIAQARPESAQAQAEKRLRQALETPYTRWLNEEAVYIISGEERAAFLRLTADEERVKFIEQFWLRRDPTPRTQENEYRDEHYRRIAYANDRFGTANIPGWKTDRGMIYIKYGPPDEKESHPASGGNPPAAAYERWRYRYIEGMGNDVNIEFRDSEGNGAYPMTTDPAKKTALLFAPGAGLTLESLGLSGPVSSFTRTDGTRVGPGVAPQQASSNQVERLRGMMQGSLTKVEPPAGELIEDVVFRGARRASQDLLRAVVKMHPGSPYERDVLDHDFLALWNTNRFDDIAVTFERGKTGWIATFDLVERPVFRPN